ncbi:ABC transporter ATP-binding protein [Ferrovibrio sp.]|uniref:ABC transporter ATP-binding protein n=1 Tax=Ferrovibrio sp. TaxID=1917215 RepID=UPI0025B7E4BB|nr:ABC transporter ATP-binding protein [Ferrovibrio sp.]MBX3453098.1 ABC transporter ATP-binding protein [Ferrovibrio sp.]
MALLDVRNLVTEFTTPAGPRRAVNDVSFAVQRGEILGLVGESGSGKSVTALSVMGLVDNQVGRVTGGNILFDNTDLTALPAAALRALRGKRLSMIFQEPLSALNPCYTIGDQISEAFVAHGDSDTRKNHQRVLELLRLVHIPDPEGVLRRYPHEISGGMRQRAMIAMALAYTPDLLIADEPTTALDVTIQAQVLNLIDRLRRELGLGVLLITHDIGIVAQYTDRVAVMYGGRIVETGPTAQVFATPKHPYTIGLLGSVPRLRHRKPGEKRTRLQEIPGSVPSIAQVTQGCRFAGRCSHSMPQCEQQMPPMRERGPGHDAACYWEGPA